MTAIMTGALRAFGDTAERAAFRSRRCAACGTGIGREHGNRKYCYECSLERDRERARRRRTRKAASIEAAKNPIRGRQVIYETTQTLHRDDTDDGRRGITVQITEEPEWGPGCVKLAIEDDLYGHQYYAAFLTPPQARQVAIGLIQAAEIEEGDE
jgi:hypothetical protein